MNTTAEDLMAQKVTDRRILCPICQRNNNFNLVVFSEGSKYFLAEQCPKCQKHFEDIKEIPSRIAHDYLPAK